MEDEINLKNSNDPFCMSLLFDHCFRLILIIANLVVFLYRLIVIDENDTIN